MITLTLPSGIIITRSQPEHVEALAILQRIVFPTLSEAEILTADNYRSHINIFPEGQFVALDGERVVGSTSTLRVNFDLNDPTTGHHTFNETVAGGWFTSHLPDGEWLYGADMGTHPDYRRLGLGRAFYRVRQQLAREIGCKGQLIGGMLSGYQAVSDLMTVEQYYAEVVAGKRFDPTASVQQKLGFKFQSLLLDYIDDPLSGNASVMMTLDADSVIA